MKVLSRRRSSLSLGVLAACAFSALAFAALPAMAQAAPKFVNSSTGKALAKGSAIRATSTNTAFKSSLGTLSCKKVTLNGTVTSNPPAATSGTGTSEECEASGVPVFITVTDYSEEFFAGGSGSATMAFNWDVPAFGLVCHLEGTVPMTWTSGTEEVEIVPNSALTGGGSAGCPGSQEISGSFRLETTAATPVPVNLDEK
jgi:hypothetical protein